MTNIAILSIPFHPVMNSFCPGERGKKTSSRLVIANVERSDSGNYSCTTDTALPSTIVVFVSDGKQEEIESKNYSCTTDTALPSTIVVFVSDGEQEEIEREKTGNYSNKREKIDIAIKGQKIGIQSGKENKDKEKEENEGKER